MKTFFVTVVLLFLTANSEVFANQRIIGGSAANIADFPYTLALRRNNVFACGASAIHRLWAITTVDCFGDGVFTPTQFQLRGGSTNREVGGFLFNVNLIVIHAMYVEATQDFNVGLARVFESTPIEGFNVQIIPIAPLCAAECCHTCNFQITTITGWGIDDTSVQPLTLRQIPVPAVTRGFCSAAWPQTLGHEWFCVESTSERGFCQGDLGNPAVTNVGGVRVQTGIVARFSCGANANQPSVIVRLEEIRIRNWIQWVTGV